MNLQGTNNLAYLALPSVIKIVLSALIHDDVLVLKIFFYVIDALDK
jgi:hypothetical protein